MGAARSTPNGGWGPTPPHPKNGPNPPLCCCCPDPATEPRCAGHHCSQHRHSQHYPGPHPHLHAGTHPCAPGAQHRPDLPSCLCSVSNPTLSLPPALRATPQRTPAAPVTQRNWDIPFLKCQREAAGEAPTSRILPGGMLPSSPSGADPRPRLCHRTHPLCP